MTEITDEKNAITKLQDSNLLLNIINEIQKEGVIGEEETILVCINKIMLRKTKGAKPTSSNIIISDITGCGKDYIFTKICNVVVEKEKYYHRTDISDKTFDYWKPLIRFDTIEEDGKKKRIPVYDTWDGYVLHLEDPREEALNGQSFKVMSSGGTEVTKVIDNKARDIKIEGKPVIVVTSLKTLLDNEGLRRWDTLRIDTTTTQTHAINKYKLLKASGKITFEPDCVLRNALQKNLYEKDVIIPYAEKLFELLPDSLITRTQTDKLLDNIKSSAILHQYQREKQDNNTIIANGFDLAYGWFVFTHLNSSHGIPTNVDEEEVVKLLKREGRPLSINEFSNLYTRHSKQWLYNNKEKLISKGLVKTIYQYESNANKDIEMITIGDNALLVLKGFNEVLKYNDMISFKGFNGFKDICERLNENRTKNGLKKTFSHVFCENLENLENLSRKGLLKPLENTFKTSLLDRLEELKTYCDKIKADGHKITYENLCFNFDKNFIENCKRDKILIPLPDGNYDLEVF